MLFKESIYAGKVKSTKKIVFFFVSEPCPSSLFQGHVKEVMMSEETLTTSFLNSLLNQLNWAFSEFIGMLQEVLNFLLCSDENL
jgi:hypothetical protein